MPENVTENSNVPSLLTGDIQRIKFPQWKMAKDGNDLVISFTEDMYDSKSPVYEARIPLTLRQGQKDG